MLISDNDAIARLNSPINLINQIRSKPIRASSMGLFGLGRKDNKLEVKEAIIASDKAETKAETKVEDKFSFNPFQKSQSPKIKPALVAEQALTETIPSNPAKQEARIDNLINNSESQIKLGLAHDSALDVLNRSLSMLSSKLDDVKAEKLPAVISAASKTVESIRKERNEASKSGKEKEVHYHFYTPIQKKITDFEVIEVTQ